MPVDLQSPRPRRRVPRDERHGYPVPPTAEGPAAADAPPDPRALTEGLEVTICLADQEDEDRHLDVVTDHLWHLSSGTRFEVAAVHPLPGGAKLHFLVKDGGPGGDSDAVIDLLARIGDHYRWVGVTRISTGVASNRRH